MNIHHIIVLRFVSIVLAMAGLFSLATTAQAIYTVPTNKPEQLNSDNVSTDETVEVSNDVTTDADELFPLVAPKETPTPEQKTIETIQGTVVLTDATITLDANTTSDVYAAGSTVTINGEIGNDLFAAASTIVINGVVNGSARLAANEVIINGVVEHNTLIFANTVTLSDTSALYGESHLYASTVTINGQMSETIIGAEDVTINGIMSSTVKSTSETITIGSNAEFTTATTITSSQTPTIAVDAKGTQYITTKQSIDNKNDELNRIAKVNNSNLLQRRLVRFFFTLLIGIVIILVWPTLAQRITTTMERRPGATWAAGAITILITPVIGIILFFTILGIPVAIVLFFSYLLFLLFGSLATAYLLGQRIITEHTVKHPTWRKVLTLTVGLFILSMAMLTPWVGWLVSVLTATWGLGGMMLQFQRTKK